ncbi:MAG: recombinase family protein [Oscillospiraceae bacterium]|nr:recombinase family protein [Oscillospiraceae bacterium]
MDYFYMRVSKREQCEDRQLLEARKLQIPPEQIYTDKKSGKNFERDGYESLLRVLRKNDVIYIKSIDRLGRNYLEIQNQWRILTKEMGVDIAVIDMPLLDTRLNKDLMGTFIADLVLQILSFVSQSERDMLRSRVIDGLTAARERGVRFGRPVIAAPANFGRLVHKWENGSLHFNDALAKSGLTKATFYRRLREYREAQKQ